jgi:putative FmdB family regulatory protein
MPIFDYKCTKYSKVEEVLFTTTTQVPDSITCSSCGSTILKQMPVHTGFRLSSNPTDMAGWGSNGYSKPNISNNKTDR